MKKNIFMAFLGLAAAFCMTSCSEEDGTTPGGDSSPAVTIYQYDASSSFDAGDDYDSDVDCCLRLASNSATEAVYYIAEKTEDYKANLAELGEEGYKNHVINDGTKVEDLKGAGDKDVVLKNLKGSYTIAAVAVKGGSKTLSTVAFEGSNWETVAVGTYYFTVLGNLGLSNAEGVQLQRLATDETQWRFNSVFGKGKHMNITMMPDYTGEDEDGEYTFFRIPSQSVGLNYGSYGAISVRDIGYWQGDDSFITAGGFESGMYSDYSCFIMAQYFVSAGSLGYDYDYFIPDAE